MKIAYEPHPVTAERKKELREQGYTILDAIFKPADFEQEEELQTSTGTTLNADELRVKLSDLGVEHDKRQGRDKLAALLAAFERSGLSAAEWNNLADSDKAARIATVK